MKVALVNDTGSVRHFGCQLVSETIKEQLLKVDIELIHSVFYNRPITIPDNVDLVIVNGEGSIHHGNHSNLVTIASEYPSVLINAVWQDNPHYEDLEKFKYISVRESFSKTAMPPNVKVEVVPDVLFASNRLATYSKGKTIYNVGVTDSVLNQNKGGDGGITAAQSSETYIATISQYTRLCTGRFHTAAVASVLGIPFSAWSSNTHKIEGMMHDMGIAHHCYSTKQEAMDNIPTELDEQIPQFVTDARSKISTMFEGLHGL